MGNQENNESQSAKPKSDEVGTKPLGQQGGQSGGQTNTPTGGQTADQHSDPHAGKQK